jgi:hypothetical protein
VKYIYFLPWRSWKSIRFSHKAVLQIYKFENYSKWHHKFAKHNMTPLYVYYQSVFKNFAKFSSLPPLAASCPSLPLSVSCSVVWPPFMSIGSLVLWLWTTCSVPVPGWLPFMCCSWIYLPGFGPLVSLVGGVVWCYPCWDPARFVLLQLSYLFICLLFILGLMLCCWCYSL